MEDTFEEAELVALCNAVLVAAGLNASLSTSEEVGSVCSCTPLFVAATEGLLQRRVDGVNRRPSSETDRISNCNRVIGELSEVLSMDLAHISGARIVQQESLADMRDLLEIMAALSKTSLPTGLPSAMANRELPAAQPLHNFPELLSERQAHTGIRWMDEQHGHVPQHVPQYAPPYVQQYVPQPEQDRSQASSSASALPQAYLAGPPQMYSSSPGQPQKSDLHADRDILPAGGRGSTPCSPEDSHPRKPADIHPRLRAQNMETHPYHSGFVTKLEESSNQFLLPRSQGPLPPQAQHPHCSFHSPTVSGAPQLQPYYPQVPTLLQHVSQGASSADFHQLQEQAAYEHDVDEDSDSVDDDVEEESRPISAPSVSRLVHQRQAHHSMHAVRRFAEASRRLPGFQSQANDAPEHALPRRLAISEVLAPKPTSATLASASRSGRQVPRASQATREIRSQRDQRRKAALMVEDEEGVDQLGPALDKDGDDDVQAGAVQAGNVRAAVDAMVMSMVGKGGAAGEEILDEEQVLALLAMLDDIEAQLQGGDQGQHVPLQALPPSQVDVLPDQQSCQPGGLKGGGTATARRQVRFDDSMQLLASGPAPKGWRRSCKAAASVSRGPASAQAFKPQQGGGYQRKSNDVDPLMVARLAHVYSLVDADDKIRAARLRVADQEAARLEGRQRLRQALSVKQIMAQQRRDDNADELSSRLMMRGQTYKSRVEELRLQHLFSTFKASERSRYLKHAMHTELSSRKAFTQALEHERARILTARNCVRITTGRRLSSQATPKVPSFDPVPMEQEFAKLAVELENRMATERRRRLAAERESVAAVRDFSSARLAFVRQALSDTLTRVASEEEAAAVRRETNPKADRRLTNKLKRVLRIA